MIVDDLEDGASRMFHSLCIFDRQVFSFVYHGSVRRNNDMEGNMEIGIVIDGRIIMGNLYLLIHLSLPFSFV